MIRFICGLTLIAFTGCGFLSSSVDESKNPPLARAKPLPKDMSANWQFSYFQEPVFNSQLVILEAGLENTNTILLVHGLGQLGLKDWLNVIPFLEKDYHVVALDLPGFGYSGVPEGRYSPTNYARVLDSLVDKYAKDSLIVIGHSMGGAVSLRYASMYSERLKKLVLIDAAGILEKTTFVKHIGTGSMDGSSAPTVTKKKLAQLKEFSASVIGKAVSYDGVTDFLQNVDVAWSALLSDQPNTNAALSLVEENFSSAVAGLNVETEIIWGEKDAIAPVRTGKVLASRLSKANIQIIESAGHVPMKSHKDVFLGMLGKALSKTSSVASSVPQPQPSQGDLVCEKESNKTYRGKYDSVVIKHCTNIKLIDLVTPSLDINDSLVEVENLSITGNESACE